MTNKTNFVISELKVVDAMALMEEKPNVTAC
jgi:hypothetical protein